MRRTLRTALRTFRDESGNVLPMAAVGMLTLAAMIGSGVDMSRSYMVKTRLQAACDAATLAGRRSIENDGYDTVARNKAASYFNANFDSGEQGARATSFSSSTPDNGSTIAGTASTRVDTIIMKLFGFREMALSVNCSASMQVGNSDVVMVLDTTGSMNWYPTSNDEAPVGSRRIDYLRTAMKSFYDTVATATSASNARVRYGFVPYSSSVNVGSLLYALNPAYLKDSHPIQSRQANYAVVAAQPASWGTPDVNSDTSTANSNTGAWADTGATYTNSSNCSDAIPNQNPTSWANNGDPVVNIGTAYIDGNGDEIQVTTSTQPQQRYEYQCVRITSGQSPRKMQRRTYTRDRVTTDTTTRQWNPAIPASSTFSSWTYRQVTYDTSVYKTFQPVVTQTGSSGANVSSTWGGCIEERETVASGSIAWSALTGMSPSGLRDLDIDSAPTSDNATKWAPMWPQVAYRRNSDVATATTGSAASSACPRAARLLATMTESAFDTYADSLTASGSTYHDFGILWGGRIASPTGIFSANVATAPSNGGAVARHIIYMTDGTLDPDPYIQSSYGIEYHDKRITADGTESRQVTRHRQRFLALCEAVKAKGIRIWVIAFGTALTADLTTCGSTASSYSAANGAQLNTAFQDIANQVGELRITQ